jgi:diphthine synthase
MTVKALNALMGCDIVYAEFYTSVLIGTGPDDLASVLGKKIEILDRMQVEEEETIIEKARTMRVGFVTAGDTMSATTHVDLLIRARDEGIPTELYHGVSVFTACPSALGLQPYKFGRTVTLPFIENGYHPRSPYDHIVQNRCAGLHTLILLDIRALEQRYMTAHEAIDWLIEGERKWNEGLIGDDTLICVASNIGSPEERLAAGYPDDLLKKDLGRPLFTLVIPGDLHFMESHALVRLAGAPETIVRE